MFIIFYPCLETFYLVQWLDKNEHGDVLYDVLPSKCIDSAQSDVLSLDVGSICKAMYQGKSYVATILQRGRHIM